ncbi:MAG: hypothetical protein Q8Q15_00130, partial [bacterium]|nr:hypothetical protein [bacterium]
FRDHFVCIEQLWNSSWGFGGSVPGCIDGVSFKIGKLHILSVVAALIISLIIFFRKKYPCDKLAVIFISTLGFGLSIFLTLEASKPIWEAIPLMAFFQYPWRFLLLTSFFSAFLAGSIIWLLKTLAKKMHYEITLGVLLIIFLFYSNIKLFVPQAILSKTSNDYANELMLKWTTSKISDEYMPKGFVKPKSASEIVTKKIVFDDQSVKILSISEKTQSLTARIQASKDSSILVRIAPFPAWNVFIDGRNAAFKVKEPGIEIPLNAGNHVLKIVFTQTPVEKIANILSVTGVILLILGIIYRRKNEKT